MQSLCAMHVRHAKRATITVRTLHEAPRVRSSDEYTPGAKLCGGNLGYGRGRGVREPGRTLAD